MVFSTYCVLLLDCLASSFVPYVASFSGLSLLYSLTFISFIVTLITYKLDYLKCLIYRIHDFTVLDCVCNDQYKTDIVKLVVFLSVMSIFFRV